MSDKLREAARKCADELVNICEVAHRVAARTGNTFVIDREKVATMIAGRFSALAQPQNDQEAVSRFARHGVHLFETAKSLGWKDDGESPLNFIARHERQRGIETAPLPASSTRAREALAWKVSESGAQQCPRCLWWVSDRAAHERSCPALAHPQNDGDAVAYRWRFVLKNGAKLDWHYSDRSVVSHDGVEIEPLYTSLPLSRMRAEALEAIEPYLDAIVCYASSINEHHGNEVAKLVREALRAGDNHASDTTDAELTARLDEQDAQISKYEQECLNASDDLAIAKAHGLVTCLDATGLAITRELYRACSDLKADPCLLAQVGSWGDTLNDDDVLAGLKSYNEMGNASDES